MSPPKPGRTHHPLFAFLLAVLIPGAGQAYNGQPFKAFCVVLFAPLVLPWLYSLYDAPARAKRMVQQGGRFGKGGLIWVVLQTWLVLNYALLILIGLTFAGVLQ